MKRTKQIVVWLIAALGLVIGLTAPFGLTPIQAQTLGIVLVTLSLWGTSVLPNYLSSLIFFTVTLVLGLARPEVVFSGFASAAMWLIVAGFVIGAAIRSSGLGKRIAAAIGPQLSSSYPWLLSGLMLLSMLLGFLMPSSMGRAVVMMPIGLALAERLGFGQGSNGRIGVALVVAFGTHMPSFAILPSNIPNIVLSGAAETIYGMQFGYGSYLALHYPVLGLIKSVIIVGLILLFFPARAEKLAAASGEDLGHGGRQLWLMTILLVTLVLWMTDSMHGISPAWVGLAASALLLAPKIGFVPPPLFKESNDFGMLLFIAGALGLGAVVNTTGLGGQIAEFLAGLLPLAPGQDFTNFASLVGLASLTSIFTTIPGVPAVLTPMAQELANLTGFSLQTVLMTQVLGFSTIIFPYQSGPLLVAMGLSGESLKPLMRMTLTLALITFLVLVPLDFLWWAVLGWF